MSAESGAQRAGDNEVRLVIVERVGVTRRALRVACSALPGVTIVGELADIADVPSMLEKARAALVLLGPSVSVTDCLDLCRTRGWPLRRARVVTLQARLSRDAAVQLIQAGISGLLEDEATAHEVALAVSSVAADQPFVSPHVHALLATDATSGHAIHLSTRHREVLALLARGDTNREIARRLCISVRTVEMHVTLLYNKLGVNSRIQAVLRTQELGLLAQIPSSP